MAESDGFSSNVGNGFGTSQLRSIANVVQAQKHCASGKWHAKWKIEYFMSLFVLDDHIL